MEDKKDESFYPDPMFNDPPEPLSIKDSLWLLAAVFGVVAVILLGGYLNGSL
ncbi:hypothetical protein [Pseudomonas putida]|uniref:hypothetical protein n=1 Tax=Pseudomonas putida TaxID=303 RepID=UPI0013A6A190|nr:hypothetical protein [Pseudomonas putida]